MKQAVKLPQAILRKSISESISKHGICPTFRNRIQMVLLCLLVVSIFSIKKIYAQRNVDLGVFGGTSYYLGELNPIIPFSSPKYSIGPILRYNFNSRYSVRGHAIYANLTGEDSEDNQFITKRTYPASFSAHILNFSAQAEFNFFPFKTYDSPGEWTPYIFGGLGYSFMLASSGENSNAIPTSHATIPFGVGAKLNLTRRLSSGIEWSQHKTFTSNIDGIESALGEVKMFHNDWYSFLGLFITYKFFKFAADCPAYD